MLDALQHFWVELHGHMLHILALIVATTAFSVYAVLNWRRWMFWRGALELRPRTKRGNRETVLIMPDISGFSDFVMRSPSEANVAQEITLKLLDGIVRPGHRTMELAKIEGDSALLFCDADKIQPAKLGIILLAMFRAFDEAKARLSCSVGCNCGTCDHVGNLELKVLVHRGVASSFEFRGIGDVFGPAVIELYRMAKAQTKLRRFVMTSEAARPSITWDQSVKLKRMDVQLADVGTMSVDLACIPVNAAGVQSEPPTMNQKPTIGIRSKIGSLRRLALRKFQQA